jgi:hypothetical protein
VPPSCQTLFPLACHSTRARSSMRALLLLVLGGHIQCRLMFHNSIHPTQQARSTVSITGYLARVHVHSRCHCRRFYHTGTWIDYITGLQTLCPCQHVGYISSPPPHMSGRHSRGIRLPGLSKATVSHTFKRHEKSTAILKSGQQMDRRTASSSKRKADIQGIS